MRIEKIFEGRRDEKLFYEYYLSLGYDEKTAVSLALFTYGQYRYDNFSIDELYAAICRGEQYVPWEVLEQRRREEEARRRMREELKRRRERRNSQKAQPKSGGLLKSISRVFEAEEESVSYEFYSLPDCIEESVSASEDYEEDLADYALPTGVPESASSAYSSPTCAPESASSASRVFSAPASASAPRAAKAASGGYSTQSSMSRATGAFDLAGALGFATDEYERIEEKDARGTVAEPTSTFRMTTNTASAGIILNQLRNDRRIDSSMVRIEEMLNYFRYESEIPEKEMFNIATELMDAKDDKKYLYINVQGREEVKEKQNIIILLDVSGSMDSNARNTQAIIATIVSKLGNGDKLSLVTYSNEDHVELEAFTVNGSEDRIRVLEKLLGIEIDGWTYGSKGIERAYEIGKKNYINGGNNQVILITDGDLNFGITDKGGLEELIELKKKDNIFLSVIGTGLWNYKDDKLETLSKHGNGVYRTVNNLTDVDKSINEEYSSLVNIIAKDVKGQVEFNPEIVESYRLLGFENRTLAREDFTNDKVISEPFGSGGYGVALYELKLKTDTAPADSGLKYSKLVTTGSEEIGTVKVRYKEPLEDVSHELEKVIENATESFTDNLRLAFVVYVCAEKLRGSDKISDEEIALAKKLYKELGDTVREKNEADLFKLAGILEKSEKELGIGIPEGRFPW